jgi:hypothetical protein
MRNRRPSRLNEFKPRAAKSRELNLKFFLGGLAFKIMEINTITTDKAFAQITATAWTRVP